MQSKKPSDAKPPDGTVLFIDGSLGVEPIRTELINCRLVVEIHEDHFARDEEDCVWLKAVRERGWVVLTKDQRLRYRPLEISALRASNARVFVLTAGNLRGNEIAAALVAALPRILRILRSRPGPFVAARFTSRARRDQLTGSGVESVRSPNGPNWRFGVQLASKSPRRKSFVFSRDGL